MKTGLRADASYAGLPAFGHLWPAILTGFLLRRRIRACLSRFPIPDSRFPIPFDLEFGIWNLESGIICIHARLRRLATKPRDKCGLEIQASNLALRHKPREMLKRPVIRAFGICRETTGRQFPGREVKLQAITADSFSRTGFITAITALFISFRFTFHV